MPVMSFLVTVNAPAGLGIYWATSAFFSFLITVLINFYYDHVDMEKIIEKQMEKAAKDIEKRKASGKKSWMERMSEAAMGQQQMPESDAAKATRVKSYANMNLKNYDASGSDSDSSDSADDSAGNGDVVVNNPKKGSLADKANAVQRFNDTGV